MLKNVEVHLTEINMLYISLERNIKKPWAVLDAKASPNREIKDYKF